MTTRKMTGALVLVWVRSDRPRAASMEYWRGPHSQLVARTPGFREYRQHHFPAEATGLWPAVDGAETTIPVDRRLDGTPEVWFDGPLSNLKSLTYNPVVQRDERNVFSRTLLHATLPWGGRWYDTASADTGCRAVILLRRRPGASGSAFASTVLDRIGPTLAAAAGVTETRAQVFQPFTKWMWNSPDVAHDYPTASQFHGVVVVGATDHATLHAALNSTEVAALGPRLTDTVAAIHAYPVATTYIYREHGRPTLPQLRPEAKPGLDPVHRKLPPAPPQPAAGDLPPGRVIELPDPGRPEDVIVDRDGRLVCGLEGGAIVAFHPDSETPKVVADTGGRPLGLELMPDGRVLVCDAHRGLLAVDPASGAVQTLVHYVDDTPLRFCSNAVVDDDGAIWFTESTNRFDFEHYLGALLEHRPSGRLFRRDPDGTVSVVKDGLHFANGLALTPDRTGLLYVETGAYSISKLCLTGEQQGRTVPVRANLPGFPDNLSRFTGGRCWFPLTNPRNPALDRLATMPGIVRKLVWNIPDSLQPEPEKTVWAIAIDPDGHTVDEIHGTHPNFHTATGVVETGGRLYLASPRCRDLLELDLGEAGL
ncbi:SMP-30/gluconolactonase/LRE family protein [Williamsia sterculiae]|uniref:SMP-30/Gluconolaconase/LRE-like region-containing protein n=1 Tax=Williamsia sterculiae TaxID=1344003 RepID=A0A1N7HF35_9NOCA|nr:SMP-30/gluconolactonase/LRE family protein [Williamsia sterculiae]SIS23465.1 SMP-30/Gluconolaconase/LRE-like region-containing protein [Williamsia sterculiae]